MADDRAPGNGFERLINGIYRVFDIPVTWFRETIVVPNRPKSVYYHRQYKRVPTIDECYEGDVACCFEADMQYKRDRRVDEEIVNILRKRREDCYYYEDPDNQEKCKKVNAEYDKAAENFFIKYGDLNYYATVVDVYMKQKHRMIWERRHPPKPEESSDELSR